MSKGHLEEKAKEYRNQLVANADWRERALAELEIQGFELEKLIEAAGSADNRSAEFKGSVDGKCQCPGCWMYDGIHTTLIGPLPDAGDHVDAFRCDKCDRNYTFRYPTIT
jgi:hypothetical protein